MRLICHLAVLLVVITGCIKATSPDDFASDYADYAAMFERSGVAWTEMIPLETGSDAGQVDGS